MKFTLHENLVLVIEPETTEEQALVNLLDKMELQKDGTGIMNAGMDWKEGRRSYMTFAFRPQSDTSNDSITGGGKPDRGFTGSVEG